MGKQYKGAGFELSFVFRATKQRGDQDGQRDGKRDDKNTSIRMTRTKAVVTLAVLFLLASAAGTPTFAAEDVEVKTNDALAELAQQMISTEGVLENVTMNTTGGVTDLTPLSGLKHIKNSGLYIQETSNLVSLAPLENLEVVDDRLWIMLNGALTDISLPSLTEVGFDLGILYNEALANISLPSLTEVGMVLMIDDNDGRTSFDFPSLESGRIFLLPDSLRDWGYVAMDAEKAGTDLSLPAFPEVVTVFLVKVTTNEELAELAQQMISADGVLENFTISITGGVTDLTPLSGLKHIKNGGLEVTNATNLVSLAPLENLEVIDGNFTIGLDKTLTEISLPSLTEVGGTLGIMKNTALTAISLPSLTEVGEHLLITENAALTAISLPSLTEVGGYLGIYNNAALTAISLPWLTEVGEHLLITKNAALTDISLPLLTEVGGNLKIAENAALTGISLPSLTEVGGYLGISYNAALTDLSLPLLTEVAKLILLKENDALASLDFPSL